MMRLTVLAALATLAAPPAIAQTVPIIAYPPQNDTVSLSLVTEDWVRTETARTELAIEAALPGRDAGRVRGDVLNAVKGLADGADWRFTRFDHDQDSSGLERWHGILEARLPEGQLGGLSDRARQASKPGLQIMVQATDFSPTLAEVEAVRAKLRGDLYKRVNEALAQLGQAEPDRKYRIQRIDFGTSATLPAMLKRGMATMQAEASPSDQPQPIDVSEKLRLTANVTFAALAPRE